jgi:hypothetical protein
LLLPLLLLWRLIMWNAINCSRKTKVITASFILGVLIGLFTAFEARAASVFSCVPSSKKCVIRLEAGIAGDPIRVLDDKARTIATGRIIKRRGAYAVISLAQVLKEIRKGYPVIVNVENRSSNLQWASAFGQAE